MLEFAYKKGLLSIAAYRLRLMAGMPEFAPK